MALLESSCDGLQLIARGKVRDLYDVDKHSLLFVATDRISAFDVLMKNGIPGKGELLTEMSVFWFNYLHGIVPHHLITTEIDEMPENVRVYKDQVRGRCLLVKKLKVIPIEAIVRGYITGSGWKEYTEKQSICDIPLPKGLVESQKLPQPLFTPSTKAAIGEHDENIHPSKVAALVGDQLAKQIQEVALKLYAKAAEYALSRNIIIADTKFEFGVDESGTLHLIDEVLTPVLDSSRFWPADEYKLGQGQNSFDKQYVRNYLLSLADFNKKDGIELPHEIIQETQQKYRKALELLTGKPTV